MRARALPIEKYAALIVAAEEKNIPLRHPRRMNESGYA